MREFIEDIGMVLTDPSTLIATARAEGRSLGRPFLFVVIFSLGLASGLSIPITILLSSILPIELGIWIYAMVLVFGILAGIVLWIIDSVFMYLLSILFNGRGSFSDTMEALGYAYAATWPIALFGSLSILTGWFVGLALLVIGIVIEIIWRIYSMVLALAEAHGYSVAKGVLIVLLSRCLEVAIVMVISMAIALSMSMLS